MEIRITNDWNGGEPDAETVREAAASVLNALGLPDARLSILITGDDAITELNEKYLRRNHPTNVMAFPMKEGPFKDVTPNLLGDVVISGDTAKKESEAAGMDFQTRFFELLIHGILHLLGYDHETSDDAAAIMEGRTRELLRVILDRD